MRPLSLLRAAALGLLIATTPLLAADADRVDRYIELTRMEAMLGQMQQTMLAGAEHGLQQAAAQRGLDVQQVDKARDMLQLQLAAMAEALSWESLRPEFAALIGDTFTDAELDAANAYFSSPEGQSMLDKQPLMMQKGAQIGQRRMAEVMPVLQSEMQRIIEAIGND